MTGAQTVLFLAGQVAYDDKGGPAHRGDFAAQARAVYQAIKAQVEAGGGTMQSIVKLNTYLTDLRHRADLIPVRQEFFGKRTLASTLVGVTALANPDWPRRVAERRPLAVYDPAMIRPVPTLENADAWRRQQC